MKRPVHLSVLFITLSLLITCFTSCVTIFCRDNTMVNIRSDKGARLLRDSAHYVQVRGPMGSGDPLLVDGGYVIPQNGLNISVPRSKTEELPIVVVKDSLRKTIRLRPTVSSKFYYNVLSYGLGFLVDFRNPNRFGYRSGVYVNIDDPSDAHYHRYASFRKNDLTFNLSVPYVNSFYFNDGKANGSQFGFWGVAAGANYYYSDNKFVSLQAGAAINLPIPVPAAVDYFGDTITVTNATSLFLNIKDNYVIGRFDLGYGLSVSRNTWREIRSIRDSTREYKSNILHDYVNTSIGGSFSAYYRLGRTIHMGLLYQPYLFSLSGSPAVKYEHTISFDVLWRFRL